MTLRALIFGLDGVLAETHEARRTAFNTVFSEAGLAWHWDSRIYASLLKATGGEDMIGAFVRSRIATCRQTDDLLRLMSVMTRRHASIYRDLLDRGAVHLRAGVTSVLYAAAREGLRLAIAAQEREAQISSLLKSSLGERTSTVFEVVSAIGDGTDEIGASVHARALRMLALAPGDCLSIESSAQGLGSAAAAGIPSLLTWGLYPQLQECGDALLANEDPSGPATLTLLARWDCGSPEDVLGVLRRTHSAQAKSRGELASSISAAWPLGNKEFDHVGGRHLEN